MAVTYSRNGTIVRTVMPTDAVSTRRIDSEQGINVVDENGYIGAVVTDYFPHTGNTYYNNFAIVINNADFSQSGLGRVTFITPGTADIGGRTYRTVNIGGVTWLAENLDFKFSGCNIGGSGSPTTPNAWYYNNDETTYGVNGYKCGLLYNYYAVNLLITNKDILCPGWHVPSNDEWDALCSAIGGTSTAGTKLKATDNSVTSNWPSRWNGTNDYDFSVLPAGYYTGSFGGINSASRFWTTTPAGGGRYFYIFSTSANASSNHSGGSMTPAHSLRLVKDAI